MKLKSRLALIYIWLGVAIEPKHRQILQIDISFERTMLVAERFISSLIEIHMINIQFQQQMEEALGILTSNV